MSEKVLDLEGEGLFCPGCGYDLRMSEGRCPECGREFDRATLAVSRIPWVHRKEMGRVRAWFKTVWMVLRRPAEVGAEVARPVDWGSAKRFSWVTIWVVMGALGVVFASIFPLLDLTVFDVSLTSYSFSSWPNPLGFPILALWTGPGLILVAVAAMLPGWGAGMWWVRACFLMFGGSSRDRASALACYLSAVLIVGFVGALYVALAVCALQLLNKIGNGSLAPLATLIIAGQALHLLILGWVTLVVWKLFRRATRRSGTTTLVAGLLMLVGGAAIFGTVAFAVNYLLGLLGLMLRSLWP